ncbi:MAG: (d)CMP kinase [Candidatus Aenigmatarchaeota archaeon]
MTEIKRFENYEKKLRKKYGEAKSPVFTVSGLAGVGTTTTAKILEKEYDLKRYNAGDFFREKSKERNIDIYRMMENLDEISDKEGKDLDIECDKLLLELPFKRSRMLIESRIAGILLNDIADIRIWVKCPPQIVAERISKRENKKRKKALKDIGKRNKSDIERYRRKYNVNIKNQKYYNVIVDTSESIEYVEEDLLKKINDKIEELDLSVNL